jgi:hypothetical protein
MMCNIWYIFVIVIAAISLLISSFILYRGNNKGVLLFGWIFTAVALYRAILPTMYEKRTVWYETPANSTMVVRLIALVAEVCFAFLVFYVYKSKGVIVMPFLVLIIVAQFFATTGAYTAYNWLFCIEESLWALAGLILLIYTFYLKNSNFKSVMITSLLASLIFVTFSLIERWSSNLGKNSDRSWVSFDNKQRSCQKYGTVFLIWHASYFTVMAILVVYLQMQVM